MSLDKQVVSDLSGATGTRNETGDTNCNASEDFECKTNEDACEASFNAYTCRCTLQQNCGETLGCNYTKSLQLLCCDETVNQCTIPVKPSVDVCPATNDSLCDACSNTPGCVTPIPETKIC